MAETIIVVVGCLLSFFAGAFVRKPFIITKAPKPIQQQELSKKEQREREEFTKQFDNLLKYSGGDDLYGS